MILKYKYSIGTHVMFYEIEMFSDYIDGMINLMETVENNENVYFDIVFNVSQFFEKIDTSKIDKIKLIQKFEKSLARLSPHLNPNTTSVRIVDDDNKFFTQTDYRRQYNTDFCKLVDVVLWGETDSFFPKQTFSCLDMLVDFSNQSGIYRYIACFSDRKMWDSSWDVTVHPKYLNHTFIESDYENVNQAKSKMSIEEMNNINDQITDVGLLSINYPKIDGACLALSSDLIKSGVNIPPYFTHIDDGSLSAIAVKLMGDNYQQFVFKNVIKVHARRHPLKRMYILNENNPHGFCNEKKGSWWELLAKMSQHNLRILIGNQGKFLTFEDFRREND